MVNLLSPESGIRILLQKTLALLNHGEEAIRPIASEQRRAATQALQHQERALPSTSLGILFPSPVQQAIVVHQISAVMSDVAEADAMGRKLNAHLVGTRSLGQVLRSIGERSGHQQSSEANGEFVRRDEICRLVLPVARGLSQESDQSDSASLFRFDALWLRSRRDTRHCALRN